MFLKIHNYGNRQICFSLSRTLLQNYATGYYVCLTRGDNNNEDGREDTSRKAQTETDGVI